MPTAKATKPEAPKRRTIEDVDRAARVPYKVLKELNGIPAGSTINLKPYRAEVKALLRAKVIEAVVNKE